MVNVQYIDLGVLTQVSRDQYRVTTSQDLEVGSVVNIEAHAPKKAKELKTVASIIDCNSHKADNKLRVYDVLLENYKEPIGSHEEERE